MADDQTSNQDHRPRRARGGVFTEDQEDQGQSKRRQRRRILIWFSVGLVAVLAIGATVAGLYVRQLQTTFNENRTVIDELQLDDQTSYDSPEGSMNMLLLGSDSRGEEEAEYRTGTGEGAERSDTIMFAHIPEDRSGIYIMSIMRDLWLDIPGYGEGRVNTALGAGGIPLVVDTVNELLQTRIDHVAVIDFDGFEDLTAALGGVYVDNPRSFSAGTRNPDFYPEGTIRLEGSEALRFVRERKAFDTGDFVRVENQQMVVRAIIDRFLSSDTLTNPARIMDVVESFAPYLRVDDDLTAETLAGYALDMTDLRTSDVHFFTMPMGENATTTGGAEVILPNQEAIAMLQRALAEEDMDGFLEWMESGDGDDLSEYPDLLEPPEDEGAHAEEELEDGPYWETEPEEPQEQAPPVEQQEQPGW